MCSHSKTVDKRVLGVLKHTQDLDSLDSTTLSHYCILWWDGAFEVVYELRTMPTTEIDH